MSEPTKYDSSVETLKHIQQVQRFLIGFAMELMKRAMVHDASKLEDPEKSTFDEWTPKLAAATYNSPEYKAMLTEIQPALKHHYARNSHHPEHFPDGIRDMSLADVVEMLCDWKAATLRQHDGNLRISVEQNQGRFRMSDDLKRIFINTLPLLEEVSK